MSADEYSDGSQIDDVMQVRMYVSTFVQEHRIRLNLITERIDFQH